MKLANIHRLPYESDPPFDCISDNATCPSCNAGTKGNHGRHGGGATFAMNGTMPDGRRIAITLRVLLAKWLPCTPSLSDSCRRVRGAYLERHLESYGPGTVECIYVVGRCDACDGEWTCLGADEVWRKFGNDTGDDNQSEAFWGELESWLVTWASRVPVLS